jgi:hypothetical protein
MKKSILILSVLFSIGVTMSAQDYDDDIYYNPKKDTSSTKTVQKKSNYIANMADMDVDAYNRRGQYYYTSVDTIGSGVESGEDFVYTQQIQKYYNPTIVIDNADALGDVLENSYGNVNIVIEDGNPVFVPAGLSWYMPYSYWGSYAWNYRPYGWGISWYDPWFSWSWGPGWSWSLGWDPYWSWGWGLGWSWGHTWGPGHDWGGGHYANYRPRGNNRVGASNGWAQNTRAGSNAAHRGINGQAGSGRYAIQGNTSSRYTNGAISSGSVTNNHRTGGIVNNSNSNATHRSTTSNSNRNAVTTRSNSYNNNNNYNSSNHRSSSSSGSFRSNSGGFGGGSRSGGGGGGGHRR